MVGAGTCEFSLRKPTDGISTEVLRPEVSVTAPKDAEVVTITEAGLFRSP